MMFLLNVFNFPLFMHCLDSLLLPLLSGAVGALIGTFGGVYFSYKRQEKSKEKSRKMALKAISIFKKYSKKDGTYDNAEQDFNVSMSLGEKRTILVALHKLGIPIIVQPDSRFSLASTCFDKIRIDQDELDAIASQIEGGLCDHLFFIDPESYFNENIRIRTFRSLAIRWTNEVLDKSQYNVANDTVYYPKDWFVHFSWGEKLALGVFKQRVSINEYFNDDGKANHSKIVQLVEEIERGVWDNCLCWDFESYQSVQSTYSLNSQLSSMLQANILSNNPIKVGNSITQEASEKTQ